MATLRKTPSGIWKAPIRKKGWSTSAKTFRTKRDAEDWARRAEAELAADTARIAAAMRAPRWRAPLIGIHLVAAGLLLELLAR